MRVALILTLAALGCANSSGPFCLSGVTTYVEAGRSGVDDEARAGVSLEWNPSREACGE